MIIRFLHFVNHVHVALRNPDPHYTYSVESRLPLESAFI